jgi:hypothetical protein
MDLYTVFEALTKPSLGSGHVHFAARPLPRRPHDFIAKGTDGQPALLLAAAIPSDQTVPPPIVLEHLRVDYGLDCVVQQLGEVPVRARFSVIRCVDADRLLQEYFLRSLLPVVEALPIDPPYADIMRAVHLMVELFQKLGLASRKPIQGLWAELFLIAVSEAQSILADAWHATPGDLYDFSSANERLEVKSAASAVRCHHFLFEQLEPPSAVALLIASVVVLEAGDGRSVFDLVDCIRATDSCSAQTAARIDQVIAATLGTTWRQAADIRYDFERAMDSLRFFSPLDVPRISAPLPEYVSAVRFRSNLAHATQTDLAQLSKKGPLFTAIGLPTPTHLAHVRRTTRTEHGRQG